MFDEGQTCTDRLSEMGRFRFIHSRLRAPLACQPVSRDQTGFQNNSTESSRYFRNRSIMITGAGGTVGAELCEQLLRFNPARLVLVDRCELALYSLEMALREEAAQRGILLVPVLDCITRQDRMERLIQQFSVSAVLNTAAYKHVPMVETNPVAGIENNLFGTLSVARAAKTTSVDRFLQVSTDKAIAPRGMLGASKYLAEQAVFDLACEPSATRYSIVRFGNVYGSSGSVVPLFQRQISRGGPITLTDPEATRYFMSIGEAANLVLSATALSKGGDIFALEMGRPQSILALARKLMRDAGKPGLRIEFTGLRPGERLHEQSPVSEDMLPTCHPKIFRSASKPAQRQDLRLLLRGLKAAVATYDSEAVRRLVEQWVYAPSKEEEAKSL